MDLISFYYILALIVQIKAKLREFGHPRQAPTPVHLCLKPIDKDLTNFLDHQPPSTIPEFKDRIYSVSANMHITQALVIFVCDGPVGASDKVIRPGHQFYSEKKSRFFRISSIPDNQDKDSFKGELCELQHIDQPIWFPTRLDPQNQSVVCAKESFKTGGPKVILEKHPVTGNMLISHGLMHRSSNLKSSIQRKFLVELFSSKSDVNSILSVQTNAFFIDPPVAGISWINQSETFKDIIANQPFNLSLEILNEEGQRVTTGFASTLMVEVTLTYDLKHFYGTSLKAGFLYKSKATLAGSEVKISKRTNDSILQKRAEDGFVEFSDVRILEENMQTTSQFGLNATLLIPRGFWNRVPNDYSDLVCVKQSSPDGIIKPESTTGKVKGLRLYLEGSYPWQAADTEEKEFYTYDTQCVVKSKAVALSDKFFVGEQKAARIDLYENFVRLKEATFTANFHISNISYVVVDEKGQRIYTGQYSNAEIDVSTLPENITIDEDGRSNVKNGMGTFYGSVVQVVNAVRLCFYIKKIPWIEKNCTERTFKISGQIHLAVFGHLKSTGVFSHPDPLIKTFAKFAVEDINDGLGKDMLKDYLPVFPKDRKLFIEGFDTKLDLYTSTSKFRKLSISGQNYPYKKIRAIIGFMSDSLSADLYPLISRDKIVLIGVREQEDRIDAEYFVRLSATANQFFDALGKFLSDRHWNSISVLRSETSDLDKTFFDAMKRHKISVIADVFILQTPEKEWNNETYHRRIHTLPETTKINFCYIRSPGLYMVLRQAIRNRKSPSYGYQWIMLGIPGLEFPFANSHPICRIKGYVSQFARGYDAVILFARAIHKRIIINKTIHENDIAAEMRNDVFEGLTGKVRLKHGERQDFVGSVISVRNAPLNTDEIVTAQMCRNLTFASKNGKLYMVETLQQSEYEVKNESEVGQLTLPKSKYVQKRRFYSRAGIISRRDQSLTMDYNIKKVKNAIVEVCTDFDECRPVDKSIVFSKNIPNTNPNMLVRRVETILLSHYCVDGCGGNQSSEENQNEYARGRCLSLNKCVCKSVRETWPDAPQVYWDNKAYAGPTCSQAICQQCDKGVCTGPQTCVCHPGYTGAQCNEAICEGGCGVGNCISPNKCVCPPGLVGKNCSIILTVLVGPIVIFILLIGCFCISLFFHWKKRAEWQRLMTSTDWLVKWEDVSHRGKKSSSMVSGSVSPLSGRSGFSGSRFAMESIGSLPENIAKSIVIWRNQKCYMTKLHCESINIALSEVRMEIVVCFQMNHANIVVFIGTCVEAPNCCILTEFYSKGSLEDVLNTHKVPLDWDVKFSMLKDIAKGMEYIHESSIGAHGKLKSSNCLMDNRWSIRIGGFGLTTIRKAPKLTNDLPNPTEMLWTAPELLRLHSKLSDVIPGTVAGDVYSFAIIISELCTEDQPYALERNVLSTEEILILLKNLEDPANRGLRTTWISYGGSAVDPMRPAIHKSQLPQEPQEQKGIVQLMSNCWKEYEALRPSFKEVLTQLNSIKQVKGDLVDILIKRLEQYSLKLEEQFVDASKELQVEKERLEELLGRLLPKKIVEDMIHGKKVEAEQFEMVTVCFSDISDFISMAKELSPYEVINLLNGLYMCFDSIIENFDVYKVETVRDEYMVVSGLPVRNGYMHASEIALLSLHLMAAIVDFDARYTSINRLLMLRIGMHSGPCVAGVVGLQMPRYCLFGDTVNTASRMKSSSSALQIHMSEATANVLKIVGGFQFEYRGEREVKGRGKMKTYWLKGADNFTKPLPNTKLAVASELQQFK